MYVCIKNTTINWQKVQAKSEKPCSKIFRYSAINNFFYLNKRDLD